MKRDWYDPGMPSACLYAERKKSVKASTLWSMKAGVSSIIAQRKPAAPRILFPTLFVFMSNQTSVEVKNFETFLNRIHPLVRRLSPRNLFVSLSDRYFLVIFSPVKELYHKEIAVLSQFCAEVITQRLHPYTKCSSRLTKKISNKFHHHNNFFHDFCRHSITI